MIWYFHYWLRLFSLSSILICCILSTHKVIFSKVLIFNSNKLVINLWYQEVILEPVISLVWGIHPRERLVVQANPCLKWFPNMLYQSLPIKRLQGTSFILYSKVASTYHTFEWLILDSSRLLIIHLYLC